MVRIRWGLHQECEHTREQTSADKQRPVADIKTEKATTHHMLEHYRHSTIVAAYPGSTVTCEGEKSSSTTVAGSIEAATAAGKRQPPGDIDDDRGVASR